MSVKIIPINPNTYQIDEGGVRFFLLIGEKKAALIDTGMMCENAKEIAESLTSLPIILINTHADPDHIRGNGAFDEVYMGNAEVALYQSKIATNQVIHHLFHKDTIDLGNRMLTIIDLPGHSYGSIAILDNTNRVLIGGDSVQRHGKIYMFGPHRNMQVYHDSLVALKEWEPLFDEIWPSHADIPVGKEMIDALIDASSQVLQGQYSYRIVQVHGHEIKEALFDHNSFLLAND